jgi:hypothetical protein
MIEGKILENGNDDADEDDDVSEDDETDEYSDSIVDDEQGIANS